MSLGNNDFIRLGYDSDWFHFQYIEPLQNDPGIQLFICNHYRLIMGMDGNLVIIAIKHCKLALWWIYIYSWPYLVYKVFDPEPLEPTAPRHSSLTTFALPVSPPHKHSSAPKQIRVARPSTAAYQRLISTYAFVGLLLFLIYVATIYDAHLLICALHQVQGSDTHFVIITFCRRTARKI